MSDLPFWFTGEDKSNPVYCRACKQHIPRLVYQAGKGLCPNCLRRVSAGHAEPMPAPPTVAAASFPVPARSETARVKPSKSGVNGGLNAERIAILILALGFVIAIVRLALRI